MAGGWARELLAASVFMYTASRLVDLQQEDWSIWAAFILITLFLFG